MRRGAWVGVLVASAVVVGACGFVAGTQLIPGIRSSATPSATTKSPTKEPTSTPPTSYAKPWADRPSVQLRYRIAADYGSATGVERVRFTPDREVCDSLVFRAWPNKPEIADYGGSMEVLSATVDERKVEPSVERRGAPRDAPGTLVRLPLRSCVAAGDTVEARLTFEVVMARQSGDRVDTNGTGEMWFASAYPVLAWERGHGWMTDPAVDVFGEMDGSEEFRLSLDVVAPKGDKVLGTGKSLGKQKGPRAGTTLHRFSAGSVRNVAVSVGAYEVTTREISGVRTRIGISDDGSLADADTWLDKVELEMGRLERHLGPFPYRDLWVTVVSGETSGIEFPGAIFYGDVTPRQLKQGDVVGHELAHMWFYSLIGNDQGRDPWLDESFATYAQALADRQEFAYRQGVDVPRAARNKVGKPMTYWDGRPDDYGAGVYTQGATMLFEARSKAGAEAWDAAIRAYVAKNAHRIVRPDDFVAAVDHLPHAVETLRAYGAVPE